MIGNVFYWHRNMFTLAIFIFLCSFIFPTSGGDTVPAVQLGENKDKAFPKPDLENPGAAGIVSICPSI
jgi:hypothetical protein